MEHTWLLLVTALMIYMTPAVHGTSHLIMNDSLEVNLTRDGCGTTKVCVETPKDCEPTPVANNCTFVSFQVITTMPLKGTEFAVELSGNSSGGFVAVGLISPAKPDIIELYACIRSGDTFTFMTLEKNTTFSFIYTVERRVTAIRGRLNESLIQCEFNIPNVNATKTRAADTTFNVTLGGGRFSGSVIDYIILLTRSNLNIAIIPNNTITTNATTNNTNTNTTNITNNTTNTNNTSATNTTTSTVSTTIMTTSAGSSGPVHAHAVLILLDVFSLFSMLGA